MATRQEVTAKVLDAKREKGLSWKQIASQLGSQSHVFYTAALLGQMPLTKEEAAKAGEILGLSQEDASRLADIPFRGSVSLPPSDPTIYRFYELLQNYGTTWKALIEEEFGDGIMSAIDFNQQFEREPHPKGDRVRITLSGKFLPFLRY